MSIASAANKIRCNARRFYIWLDLVLIGRYLYCTLFSRYAILKAAKRTDVWQEAEGA